MKWMFIKAWIAASLFPRSGSDRGISLASYHLHIVACGAEYLGCLNVTKTKTEPMCYTLNASLAQWMVALSVFDITGFRIIDGQWGEDTNVPACLSSRLWPSQTFLKNEHLLNAHNFQTDCLARFLVSFNQQHWSTMFMACSIRDEAWCRSTWSL